MCTIVARVPPKELDKVLHSLNLRSIGQVDNLKALHEIVLRLEAAVPQNHTQIPGKIPHATNELSMDLHSVIADCVCTVAAVAGAND